MKEYKFKINGKEYAVSIGAAQGKELDVTVNGASYKVELETPDQAGGDGIAPAAPAPAPAPAPAAQAAAPAQSPGQAGGDGKAGKGQEVASPLPGVIVEVSVREGQSVKAGQKVAVLEAMKMENEIPAPKDGTITAIHVNKGDSILEGAPVVSIA